MPKVEREDPVMQRIRDWMDAQDPTVSLQALGERMGFPAESARKSAWQFLKCKVPRLDTLRRFASASCIPIEELVSERIDYERISRPKSSEDKKAPRSRKKGGADAEA